VWDTREKKQQTEEDTQEDTETEVATETRAFLSSKRNTTLFKEPTEIFFPINDSLSETEVPNGNSLLNDSLSETGAPNDNGLLSINDGTIVLMVNATSTPLPDDERNPNTDGVSSVEHSGDSTINLGQPLDNNPLAPPITLPLTRKQKKNR